jgi:hypothetical protein
MAFAEKKFRAKYKILQTNQSMQPDWCLKTKIQSSSKYFYTDKGLLLYYNSYEAASYADGKGIVAAVCWSEVF